MKNASFARTMIAHNKRDNDYSPRTQLSSNVSQQSYQSQSRPQSSARQSLQPIKPVIVRLDSSPTARRRRPVMSPTPFTIATQQQSTISSVYSESDYSTLNGSTVDSSPAVIRSPVKSLQMVSPTKTNSNAVRTQISPVRRRVMPPNDMTDNLIYSSNDNSDDFKIKRIDRDESEDSLQSNGDISNRLCNKYGFFVDTQEQQQKELSSEEVKLVLKREKKWLYMLQHWDKFITGKWKKVRDRCRKGIPHSMRGQAWLHLCGGHHQMRLHPLAFDELTRRVGNEQVIDEIRKDLHRQFPTHEMFAKRNGYGQTDLFNVLKAFSILKPDIGYCQGQAPIASVLLMHMPAEHAFWSLVTICDHYLPGYFSPGLEAIQLHGDMLFAFLKRFSQNAYKLMKEQNIEPMLYMMEWFMCVFSRTLPWTTVLRIWDMFLCEGIKVVFKVAIILITETLKHENKKTCPTMFETLNKIRNIPKQYMKEEFLIEQIFKLELTDRDLQREHNIQEKRRRKAKQTLNKSK